MLLDRREDAVGTQRFSMEERMEHSMNAFFCWREDCAQRFPLGDVISLERFSLGEKMTLSVFRSESDCARRFCGWEENGGVFLLESIG